MRNRAGLAALVVVGLLAPACGLTPTQDPPTADPTPSVSVLPPEVARFETGFTVLTMTGVSCDGLEGPWRVRMVAPQPIEGSDRSSFRLPGGTGPGTLRWSFTAAHPAAGTVTYSGQVTVRASGPDDAPTLRFSGREVSWGATGRVEGTTRVELGGHCPL